MGKNKNGKSGKGIKGVLHLLQHLCVVAAVIAIVVITTGSTVIVNGISGTTSYSFGPSDQEKNYEDSELFNAIYGRAAADIIRFGVIRSQLETDGEFDNDKIIDVTAYNYRDEGMPEKYVTARYKLGDLLKWYKYGLEYSSVTVSRDEAKDFLADKTMLTIVDPDSKYYNTTDAGYMKSDIGSYTFVDDVSSNMLPYDGWDGDMSEKVSFNVLVNRYKTADGKNIEDYTADLANYIALCDNVAAAMESLSHNYDEYLAFQEYYDSENTNIRYCIEKTVGKKTEYFTNMEGSVENFFDEKINRNTGKYLYYSPAEMIYESNSAIEETTIRNIVKKYDYAYPENIRIWIAVDSNYPVNDAFAQGRAGFLNYHPYFWQWIFLAVLAVVLYFALLVYLTITTGKYTDGEGNTRVRLTGFDKIPTEAGLILGVGSAAAIIAAAYYIYSEWRHIVGYVDIYSIGFKIGVGVLALLLNIIFCFFYYSLVRRMRAKMLWRNSYLKRIVRKCSKLILEVYDNGNIVVRTWVPYVVFLLFNFLMIAMGIYTKVPAVFTALIAFVIDMFVGGVLYLDVKERQSIVEGIEKISEGDFAYQVNQENMHGDNLILAKSVNNIGNGIKNAVESSMKDERMKADLITNVSHDIKTPLTSIINYVDLIKREQIDNERVRSYINVLDEKSQRLKQLTDDLVEASKISSGNINLHFERINLTELLNQTIGEFSEKFEQKGLTTVMNVNAQNAVIEADSRSIWRVMENLFNNIYKYALENTRVYIVINPVPKDNTKKQEMIELSIKNISAKELNCNPEELTERFIRGDESRTTEGSGLGLSIAKNLTEAQHGTFEIQLDGDLFKIVLVFRVME